MVLWRSKPHSCTTPGAPVTAAAEPSVEFTLGIVLPFNEAKGRTFDPPSESPLIRKAWARPADSALRVCPEDLVGITKLSEHEAD